MSTLYEVAQTLQEMETKDAREPKPADGLVTWFHIGRATIKRADGTWQVPDGYMLTGDRGELRAFIQVLSPVDRRIGQILGRILGGTRILPARTVVRALLNAEDYTSTIYDQIVRVHYVGEFTVPGNTDPYAQVATRAVGYEGGRDAFRIVGKRPELAAGYGPNNWRKDAFDAGKKGQQR